MTGTRLVWSKVPRTSDVRGTLKTMKPEQVSLWLRNDDKARRGVFTH